ncbi:MAG: ABC transporter permease [Bacteroidales bacterium]|nr:ABC transporter permease [Bacteroidales bacterium]
MAPRWLNHFWKVFRRELHLIRLRPLYFLGSVGTMTAAAVFFLTFFSEGLPQDLPVGVVDFDQTSTSRNLRQQLDATQRSHVISFTTFQDARRALESGRINGFVVIPAHFDEDVQSFRCPKMGVYVNTKNPFVGGALAYKDLLTMVNMTNGAVQREALRARGVNDAEIMARIQPVQVDAHTIGNGPSSYAYYLNNMILTAILAMSVVLVVIYSLGAELKYSTSKELLETSGDSIVIALLGKLAPYAMLFTVLGTLLELILFGFLGYPIHGSVGWMVLAVFTMVLAYGAVAVFIISLIPTLRLSISIGSLYSVLGITFTGFTLPVVALPAVLQGVSVIFPLRFYYQIYLREVLYGTGFAGWWPYLVCLLFFLFLPFLTADRLYKAYKYQNYPKN